MAEGETSEDLQTLIRADDLEGITEETVVLTAAPPSLLHDQLPAWHTPVHCTLLIIVTTALVIILPVYLEVSYIQNFLMVFIDMCDMDTMVL